MSCNHQWEEVKVKSKHYRFCQTCFKIQVYDNRLGWRLLTDLEKVKLIKLLKKIIRRSKYG